MVPRIQSNPSMEAELKLVHSSASSFIIHFSELIFFPFLKINFHFLCFFFFFIFDCTGSSLLHLAFSSCSKLGLLFVAMAECLLIALASLTVELGLSSWST